MVKLLVEKGADVDAKDNKGQTPLDLAGKKNHTDIVSFLEEEKKRRDEGGLHHNQEEGEPRNRRSIKEKVGSAGRLESVTGGWVSWVKDLGRSVGSIGALPWKSWKIPSSSSTVPNISQHKQYEATEGSSPSSFLSDENIAFVACLAKALDNTSNISTFYQTSRGEGVEFFPSTQSAVKYACDRFDSFVEKKIRNLDPREQKRIRAKLKDAYPEIIESFRRGVEFRGNVGLDDVLEVTLPRKSREEVKPFLK